MSSTRSPFSALRAVALALLAAGLAVSAIAAPKLKLGTLAPVGTSYHKILMTMAEAWRKDSAGAVDLNIFAGGKLGSESEMVGLMQVNSLQVALLTAVGLADIETGVAGLQNIPMGFRTLDEVALVTERLRPLLEERLAKKGFVVLCWVDTGWVRFFSSQPVARPDDLRKLKLFTWSGSTAQVDIYRSAGFNAVPIETADIASSLQTKLIEAVPVPPFYALAGQIDSRAPYMLELNWAPLVGALVVRQATWAKIPAATQALLLKHAATAGAEITAAGHREMTESVAAMEKRGLKVIRPSAEEEREWQVLAESVYPRTRGVIVPADIFDEALKILAEHRAGAKP